MNLSIELRLSKHDTQQQYCTPVNRINLDDMRMNAIGDTYQQVEATFDFMET